MTSDTCLGDDELYAVTDGDAEPRVQAHLEACSDCRNKLQQLETKVATFRQLYNRRQNRPDETSEATESFERPMFLGKYFIAGVLSEDQEFVLYRGLHTVLKAEVFIYRSKASISIEEMRAAILTECRRIGAIQSAGIARMLDVEFFQETPCLIVEFVEGRSLDEYVSSTQLTPVDAASLVLNVANSLAEPHRRGIAHGMLSKSSLIVDEGGQPHLIDFGVSCLRGFAASTAATASDLRRDVRALADILQWAIAAAPDERRVRRIRQVIERTTAPVEDGGVGDAGEFAKALSRALSPQTGRLTLVALGVILIALCAWAIAALAA